MTATLALRGYQTDCIDAVFAAWYEGVRRPAVVLPTGAGKTVVFAHLIRQFRETQDPNPENVDAFRTGSRALVLVHRDELADQAIAKIKAVAPDLNVGKVKAQDNDISADVMVCSVQTLAVERRLRALVTGQSAYGDVGLIITDECHHGAAPSYRKVYDAFPDALQLGVTATLARGDGVGLGDVWDDVVYTRSILWMISRGHLVDVKAQRVEIDGLDMGDVKSSRGDYQAGDLGRAMEDSHAETAIAKAYLRYAGDRPGIVFTPTVTTAEAAAAELIAAGISTAVVTGKTPTDERKQIFDDFRTGKVQVLANCMVLTEGFDAPWASCAVIARPTQSAPLYTQMVGRVLRPWPGKEDALVLDLVGSSDHKLRTLVDLEPGAVRVLKPGETLADAVVREDEELSARPFTAGSIAFDLRVRHVDMFASSDKAWLTTPKGVPFIDCGGGKFVFIWPAPDQGGLFDVCKGVHGKDWLRTEHRGLDIGTAMAWGEAIADDSRDFSVDRSARWRREAPSTALLGLATSLGVYVTGARQGPLSDAISTYQAARIFDEYV
jgi:superfamily II DNA or RNA helicase